MLCHRSMVVLWAIGMILLAGAAHARASFHFMQIEAVIGGIDGDTSAQAIQLRMRASGQNGVSQARIRAHDATGSNPVLIIDFASDVLNAGPSPFTIGACCAPNGSCAEVAESECVLSGGVFLGLETLCAPSPCSGGGISGSQGGACCIPGESCQLRLADDCLLNGGFYFGLGSSCLSIPCGAVGTIPGDANCDGTMNGFDTNPWVIALLNIESLTPPPEYVAEVRTNAALCWNGRRLWGDMNCDGALNNFDIDPFISCRIFPPPGGCQCP
ncbi:MAG: hypothetical protein IPM64_07135 [Phycisphaerales bacterium]|nr:hypothetical protein [Phycisphaerales bacterium]